MNKFKELIKGGLWVYISYFVNILVGLLLTFFYANYVSKEVFGQFNFVLSILSMLGFFTLVGMNQALTFAISEGYEGNFKKAISQTLRFSIIGSIILLFLSFFYLNKSPGLSPSLIFIALIFPLYAISTYYQSFLFSKRKFKYISLINIGGSILSLITLIFVITSVNSTLTILIALLMPPLFINLYFTYRYFISTQSLKINQTFLRLGWHLSSTNSIHFLTKSIDKFLIGLFLPFEQLAIYAFAQVLPDQGYAIFKHLNTLITPEIAEAGKKNLKLNILKGYLIALLTVGFGIVIYFILSPLFFSIFFPRYLDSLFISQIYSLVLLSIPTTFLNLAFQKLKVSKIFYLQEFSLIITLIVGIYIFVPQYGIVGAIIAQILARFIYSAVSLITFLRLRI